MSQIIPEYKMIVSYDVLSKTQDIYYRFVTIEFVPALRDMGIHMTDVYQTLWGEYPMRIVEFVALTKTALIEALQSERYQQLEDKLKSFTRNYTRKIIPYREGFQL